MKRICLLVVTVLILGLIFLQKNHSPMLDGPAVPSEEKEKVSLTPPSPPQTLNYEDSQQELQLPVRKFPDCKTYFEALWKERLQGYDAKISWLADDSGCSDIPEELSGPLAEFRAACASFFSKDSTSFQSEDQRMYCLFTYRDYLAHVLASSARGKKMSEIHDPKVLTAIIQSVLSPGRGTELRTQIMVDAAVRLFELRTDNLEVAHTVGTSLESVEI